MCHFCHNLRNNLFAPDHRSENCRDLKNTHSKYYKPQPQPQPQRHLALMGIPCRPGSMRDDSTFPTSRTSRTYHASLHVTFKDQLRKVTAPTDPYSPSRVFQVTHKEGSVGVLMILQSSFPQQAFAVVLAGNAGRIGGGCSKLEGSSFVPDAIALMHRGYKTQEESVLSDLASQNMQATMDTMMEFNYGLCDPSGTNSTTKQGVDYTCANPCDYQKAWCSWWFPNPASNPVLLIAACAPNAGKCPSKDTSTMKRTFNRTLSDPKNVKLFRLAVEHCVYAALKEAKNAGYTMVIIPGVGCGIYAGLHKDYIKNEFMPLLIDVSNGRFCDGSNMEAVTGLTIVYVKLD